jgi:hypothetical protein
MIYFNNKKLHLKSKLLFVICLFNIAFLTAQTTIPANFYGINSWMPDTINTTFYNGQIHLLWPEVEASKPSVIRIGGIAYDNDYPTDYQLIRLIDSIKEIGAEPIVQVPLWAGTKTAQNAADIVTLVNITYGRNVKYFAIGNEPFLSYNASWYGFSAGNYLPYQYAADIKKFSVAMKNMDANIKIIAGELAWYHSWVDSLLTPGGISDISGNNGTNDYVDIFSFHTYPFDSTQTRSAVIGYINSFENTLTGLNSKLAAANNFHNRNNDLKFGVTELNVTWQNSMINNTVDGVHNSGFLAGQWWSNLLWKGVEKGAELMCFWSVAEVGDNPTTDHGYISHTTGDFRPTYHQFQAMTTYFVGNYYTATTNQSEVYAGASKNGREGWAIVIHNYSQSTAYPLRLRLNNDVISGSETLKINSNSNIPREMTEIITANSTTILFLSPNGWYRGKLVYDLAAAQNNSGFTYFAHNPTRAKNIFAHYLPWFDNGTGGYGRSGWCHDYNLADGIDECTETTQKSSIYEPIIGEYSQFDSEVLKYHIRLAQAAHIDGFMVNVNPNAGFQWQVFNNLCEAALEINQCNDTDFKIILSYDNQTDSDLASVTQNFQQVYDSLYHKTAYANLIFKDDMTNKPLLIVWSESNWTNYQAAIDAVFGVDSVIVLGRNANNYDYREGIFGWISGMTNNQNDVTEWGDAYLNSLIWFPARQDEYGLSNLRNANLVKLGGVWAGFDDRLVPSYWNSGTPRFMNQNVNDGNTLELTWNKQINYTPLQLGGHISVDNPWVQLITWNDFPEGTALEPTRLAEDFGFETLQTCRIKGAIFKNETAKDSIGVWAAYEIYKAIQDSRQADGDSAAIYFCDENYATAYAFAKFGMPILPIELLFFIAKAVQNKIELSWEIANFQNHAYFEIQYSTDGKSFETLGFEFEEKPFYEFLHQNPMFGNNYYRLKIVNNNGYFSYSNVEIITFKNANKDILIYQNENNLIIDNQYFVNKNIQLKIYNSIGQLIKNKPLTIMKGRNTIDGINLENGIYLIELNDGEQRLVKRVYWQ